MDEHQRKYQRLSELVQALPEGISPVKYITQYQIGLRDGTVTAVPLGSSFQAGRHTYKDDLVRFTFEVEQWHERTVRTLGLHKQRRGVVAHEEDVVKGEVNFDQLAAQYRQQLAGRASVKRPKRPTKRGKPKLLPTEPANQVAAQLAPGSPESGSTNEALSDVLAEA